MGKVRRGAGIVTAAGVFLEPYSLIGYFLLVLGLSLLSGIFALAESALFVSRKGRIEQLIEEGNSTAAVAKRLIEDPPRFIAATQVGLTLAAFAAAVVATAALAPSLATQLKSVHVPPSWAWPLALVLVTIVTTMLYLVLGEITPKALSSKNPEAWSLRLAPFIQLCAWVFSPFTGAAIGLSELILHPLGLKAKFEMPVVTEEELKHMIDAGERGGELEKDERVMLRNVFDLGDTPVRAVMTPRIDMTALPQDKSLDDLLDAIMTSGHSRVPIYENTIDNVVGIVHAKDLLSYLKENRRDVALTAVMRDPLFVPRTKRVSDLLSEFRRTTQQVAIVLDEDAGTAGIVTIEDLLEEIVGDIKDEYDVDEPELEVLSARESRIDGRMNISDVNERLDLELPHEEYDTIGGLVFGMLGHEPHEGDTVESDGIRFVVETIEDRRIKTIRAVRAVAVLSGVTPD